MNTKNNRKLLGIFGRLYPAPRSELKFEGEYQLAVSVILSAQCTDKKVNEVTRVLFKRYRDFRGLGRADLEELGALIRPINYYKTKAKNLISLAKLVIAEHEGKLPRTREELQELPGIGRKTANVIQCERGLEPALPVDTHVFRVSRRLGLADAATPEKVENQLTQQFDPRYWHDLHHWLILHGRRVCKAPRPLCSECGVAQLCPSRAVFLNKK